MVWLCSSTFLYWGHDIRNIIDNSGVGILFGGGQRAGLLQDW